MSTDIIENLISKRKSIYMSFKATSKIVIEGIVKSIGKLNKDECKKALIKKFNTMEAALYSDKQKIWNDEVDRQLQLGIYAFKKDPVQGLLFDKESS